MNINDFGIDRRSFLKTIGSAGAGVALAQLGSATGTNAIVPKQKLKLGFDDFSVRAMGWKTHALMEYAASLKLESILISDLDTSESLEEPNQKEVTAKTE